MNRLFLNCRSTMLFLFFSLTIALVSGGDLVFEDAPDTADGDYSLTDEEYTGSVSMLYSMVNTYMDLLFSGLVADSFSDIDTDIVSMSEPAAMVTLIQDFGVMGYLGSIAVGMLLIAFFCPCCLCFWCCRVCCNNCGGKMEQNDPGRGCCICLSVTVLITTAFLGGSAMCAYMVMNDIYTGAETVLTDIPKAITDAGEYTTQTIAGLQFILGDPLTTTTNGMLDVMVDGAFEAADDIVDGLQSDIDDALSDYNSSVADVDRLYAAMVDAIEITNTNANGIDAELERILATLNTISCTEDGCINASTATELETLCLYVFDTSVTIPELDTMTSAEFMNTSMLDTLTSELDSALDDDVVSDLTSSIDTIGNITSSLNFTMPEIDLSEIETLLADYEDYITTYAAFGMAALPGLAAVFSLLGLLMGVIGYSQSTPPTERSSLSSCGGCCLMLSACTSCCYVMLYLLLTFFIFTSFSFISYTLSVLLSPEGLDMMIDFMLSEDIEMPINITEMMGNISIDSFLSSCEVGSSAISAMGLWDFNLEDGLSLNDLLDVDTLLNYTGIDSSAITDMITDSMTFTNIMLIDNETEASMSDAVSSYNDTYLTELIAGYQTYFDALDDGTDGVSNISALLAEYNNSMSSAGANSEDIAIVTTAISDLDALEAGDKTTLKSDIDTANGTLSDFQSVISNLTDEIGLLSDNLDTVQNNFQTDLETEVVTFIETAWSTSLSYLQEYLHYMKDMLSTNVGNCYPLYVMYTVFYNILMHVFTFINAIWFVTGMISFFSVLNAIFSIKLAKFFRKMKFDERFDRPGGGGGPRSPGKHNQVVPGHAKQGW